MNKIKHTNDNIATTLTKIRNAIMAKKDSVKVPGTKMILELLKVLNNNGFIGEYHKSDDSGIEVMLKIEGEYKIHELDRVSKPGVRVYRSFNELTSVKFNRGIGILSTSIGIISDKEARTKKVGGEYLCKVW